MIELSNSILLVNFDFNYMSHLLMTLLFFPDWTNGLPSDFLILHFFVGAVIFPFNMIHSKARKIDALNPKEAAGGYKNLDNGTYYGYEEIK